MASNDELSTEAKDKDMTVFKYISQNLEIPYSTVQQDSESDTRGLSRGDI